MVLREVSSNFNCETQLIGVDLIDKRVDAERSRVLSINAIVHDKEFTIWRLNGYCFHCLEVPCVDTLMEVAVIQYNTSSIASVVSADL